MVWWCTTRQDNLLLWTVAALFNQIERDVTDIIFHNGLPNTEDIDTWKNEHTLIILDDLMNKVSKNAITQQLFTLGCYHLDISCIFITQNLYNQGRFARTITLNATYLRFLEILEIHHK